MVKKKGRSKKGRRGGGNGPENPVPIASTVPVVQGNVVPPVSASPVSTAPVSTAPVPQSKFIKMLKYIGIFTFVCVVSYIIYQKISNNNQSDLTCKNAYHSGPNGKDKPFRCRSNETLKENPEGIPCGSGCSFDLCCDTTTTTTPVTTTIPMRTSSVSPIPSNNTSSKLFNGRLLDRNTRGHFISNHDNDEVYNSEEEDEVKTDSGHNMTYIHHKGSMMNNNIIRVDQDSENNNTKTSEATLPSNTSGVE